MQSSSIQFTKVSQCKVFPVQNKMSKVHKVYKVYYPVHCSAKCVHVSFLGGMAVVEKEGLHLARENEDARRYI